MGAPVHAGRAPAPKWSRSSHASPSPGTSAVEQLRQVAVELQMAPVHDEVNLPFVMRALDAEGRPADPMHRQKALALMDQLHWWADALAVARAKRPLPTGGPPPAPAAK